jgi:hypothetical protein
MSLSIRPSWAQDPAYTILTDRELSYISTLPPDTTFNVVVQGGSVDFTLDELKQNVSLLIPIVEGLEPSLDLEKVEVEDLKRFSFYHSRARDNLWQNVDPYVMSDFDRDFFSRSGFAQLNRAYYVSQLAINPVMAQVTTKLIATKIKSLKPEELKAWLNQRQ